MMKDRTPEDVIKQVREFCEENNMFIRSLNLEPKRVSYGLNGTRPKAINYIMELDLSIEVLYDRGKKENDK